MLHHALSIEGISHDFAENTSDEDIIFGQVLAAAVESILISAR